MLLKRLPETYFATYENLKQTTNLLTERTEKNADTFDKFLKEKSRDHFVINTFKDLSKTGMGNKHVQRVKSFS